MVCCFFPLTLDVRSVHHRDDPIISSASEWRSPCGYFKLPKHISDLVISVSSLFVNLSFLTQSPSSYPDTLLQCALILRHDDHEPDIHTVRVVSLWIWRRKRSQSIRWTRLSTVFFARPVLRSVGLFLTHFGRWASMKPPAFWCISLIKIIPSVLPANACDCLIDPAPRRRLPPGSQILESIYSNPKAVVSFFVSDPHCYEDTFHNRVGWRLDLWSVDEPYLTCTTNGAFIHVFALRNSLSACLLGSLFITISPWTHTLQVGIEPLRAGLVTIMLVGDHCQWYEPYC